MKMGKNNILDTTSCLIMRQAISFLAACAMSGSAMAAVSYSYEDDGKTYVANVTSAETAISDEAITVLDANEITNFAVRGSAALHVNKGTSYAGDVRATTDLRLSAENSLGVGPGKIYVKEHFIHMTGAMVSKDVSFDCGTGWGNNTGVKLSYRSTSAFKGKVTFTDRNFILCPYVDSRLVFEGGLEGSGGIQVREATGGTVVFTNMPLRLSNAYPISIQSVGSLEPNQFYYYHFIFAVAGNQLAQFMHSSYRFQKGELKTTVDWAFDNSSQIMYFANDCKWDLCGTSQRVGYLNFTCPSGNASVITNSFAAPATLYVTQTANATPAAIFGGNLSVDFSGNKITTIDYANTAKGGITVNAGTLAFTENGSWANATNVTVKGSAKITIANANAFRGKADVNLAANSSLEIASGLTVNVRTLTIGGVQQPRGDYTFGSGTLHVSRPCGFILCVH